MALAKSVLKKQLYHSVSDFNLFWWTQICTLMGLLALAFSYFPKFSSQASPSLLESSYLP
jgi:hypothetical protein